MGCTFLWMLLTDVQEFQAELQKRQFEVAAMKAKADDILKGRADDCPGYKELKKQKRRLGNTPIVLLCFLISVMY